MNQYVTIPHYSLKPNAITLYETIEGKFTTGNQSKGFENLNNNINKYGELSKHSYKRLRKTIDYMLYLSTEKEITGRRIINKNQELTTEYQKAEKHQNPIKYKLTFVTLTLPSKQVHTDNEIKYKCLNHFLTNLRRNYKVEKYIWKAEKQENGNIHFHILTDRYIHYSKLRTSWNTIIEKLGYVSQYRRNQQKCFQEGFKMSENPKDKRDYKTQFAAYEKGIKENWTNPNSTDIHALYKIKNLSAYMAKYLSKTVTKTNRISKIKKLEENLKPNIERNDYLKYQYENYSNNISNKIKILEEINELENQISTAKANLEELYSEGVQGFIWGCSSVLSKCKNLTVVENWSDIPEIDIVCKIKTHENKLQIGNREIKTLIFDINKTPQLKANLNFHLDKCLKNGIN